MTSSNLFREKLLNKNDPKITKLSKAVQDNQTKEYLLAFNSNNQISDEMNSNSICTSKYTVLSAFPKILIEQFSQIGNLYFLGLAILQILPFVSQSGGSPILLLPLLLVVGVNGLKDFIEDYGRKSSDQKENNASTYKFTRFAFQEVKWEDIHPGDIIKVKKDEYFPADMLLMYSTNKNGIAYVETKNLDGETNLKYKESSKQILKLFPKETMSSLNNDAISLVISKLRGNVFCRFPQPEMYYFDGSVSIEMRDKEKGIYYSKSVKDFNLNHTFTSLKCSKTVVYSNDIINEDPNVNYFSINYDNFLLRGSCLRNTNYIIGFVLYTGHYSKIMLNSLSARSKTSSVTHLMNLQLKIIVLIQLSICLVYTIILIMTEDKYAFQPYFKENTNFFFGFFTWVLSINNLVPICLLVTMEMIRYIQAFFIGNDISLYDKPNNRPAIVQSSGLNEELGQIHNIFTDKTGTLTKNVMLFKYMVIGCKRYGKEERKITNLNYIDAEINLLQKAKVTNVDFNDDTLFNDWKDDYNPNKSYINKFIWGLSLCHTVICEKEEGNEGIYNASSPDELALVNAAKFFGVEFIERNEDNEIIIQFNQQELKYKLLHILEFNSDRKRMSVLIKDLANNEIKLITKGADSVIIPLLADTTNLGFTMSQLEYFGNKGLRTLLIAERDIKLEVYNEFHIKYQKSLLPENANNKHKIIEECDQLLEQDLHLLGATAIEDCLQDDLESTLQDFRKIGIKIWMLTGDHPLTAISIGHSSGLLNMIDKTIICDSIESSAINKTLMEIIDYNDDPYPICFIITGQALLRIMASESVALCRLFKMAIEKSKCLICARVSPKQKADIVTFVKQIDQTKRCLAIGDGANDVNMINVADVGIGIYGNEGQQAARASDYAIGQFSFLRRLLFVHGYECYRKNSFSICYILWKNFLYTLPIILFGYNSLGTGQLIYDFTMDAFYNIIFTAFPIMWYAIADQEEKRDKLDKKGWQYKKGMNNKYFNCYVILRWYGHAFFSGYFLYLIHCEVLSDIITYYNYYEYDLWSFGTSMYTCVVMIVNFKLIFEAYVHNGYTLTLMIFSVSSYFIILFIGSTFFPQMRIFYMWNMLIFSLHFWATLALIILLYFTVEYGWRSINYYFQKVKTKLKKINQIRLDTMEKEKRIISIIPMNDEIDQKMMDRGFSILINEKYSGFAFSEDVANIDQINHSLEREYSKTFLEEFKEIEENSNNNIII